MLHWQARFMARFLESAAQRAEWISVEKQGDTLVFVAANEYDWVARLVVTTKSPYRVEYTDEWGLMADGPDGGEDIGGVE